jgi:hypothetical protein
MLLISLLATSASNLHLHLQFFQGIVERKLIWYACNSGFFFGVLAFWWLQKWIGWRITQFGALFSYLAFGMLNQFWPNKTTFLSLFLNVILTASISFFSMYGIVLAFDKTIENFKTQNNAYIIVLFVLYSTVSKQFEQAICQSLLEYWGFLAYYMFIGVGLFLIFYL